MTTSININMNQGSYEKDAPADKPLTKMEYIWTLVKLMKQANMVGYKADYSSDGYVHPDQAEWMNEYSADDRNKLHCTHHDAISSMLSTLVGEGYDEFAESGYDEGVLEEVMRDTDINIAAVLDKEDYSVIRLENCCETVADELIHLGHNTIGMAVSWVASNLSLEIVCEHKDKMRILTEVMENVTCWNSGNA